MERRDMGEQPSEAKVGNGPARYSRVSDRSGNRHQTDGLPVPSRQSVQRPQYSSPDNRSVVLQWSGSSPSTDNPLWYRFLWGAAGAGATGIIIGIIARTVFGG